MGRGDKKIDFFHLDLDANVATIAQSYFTDKWQKSTPPVNKAAELGTALNWLLESDYKQYRATPSERQQRS
jgi:hypothetical protein